MSTSNYSIAPPGTTRVRLEIYGGLYEVDSDQVELHLKKYAIVKSLSALGKPKTSSEHEEFSKAFKKITNINRCIRRTLTIAK